ncbi:MAG: winged helix-turn-helix transcriptional regulator [Saprospiraceae bacterium]|nr:winged helix-turn-helix transcriptional regulator [Saprospiraceae bacterium]
MKQLLYFLLLLAVSVGVMQLVWYFAGHNKPEKRLPEDKINLALRKTVHQMLDAAGDSTSRIAPVRKVDERTWMIQIEKAFNYDSLPGILNAALVAHHIDGNYDVFVLDCAAGELQLGYTVTDFEKEDVPCGGREMTATCYQLQVSFPLAIMPKFPVLGWVFGGFLAIILFGIQQKLPWQRNEPARSLVSEIKGTPFGASHFDAENQVLYCGEQRFQLTYREAKLLHLFVKNQNQLLERSFILENVWADEGIQVGRSIDMFVSRLRKFLRADPTLRLVAVHGVGYRLETV